MSALPCYNAEVSTIVARWNLTGGVVIALEVPLPVDNPQSRSRLSSVIDILEDALEPWAEVDGQAGDLVEVAP